MSAIQQNTSGKGVKIVDIVVSFYNFLKPVYWRRNIFVLMIYKAEKPVPFMIGAGENVNLIIFNILFQKTNGYYCKTVIYFDCISYGARGVFFKDYLDVQVMTG
mgnify:CR=1 FL=1